MLSARKFRLIPKDLAYELHYFKYLYNRPSTLEASIV